MAVHVVSALDTEVAAHLAVIPTLTHQLRDTAQQVETSVVEVCARFQGIARQAQAGVEQVSHLLHGSDAHDDGFGALLAGVHRTMLSLDQRLMANAERALATIDRLAQVEQSLSGVTRALDQMDDLASGLRLLAINAKIEAVRSGDKGAGFAVVADEMSKAGKGSRSLADDIRTAVATVSRETTALVTLLRESADADLSGAAAAREEIRDASDALSRNHQDMRRHLDEGAANGQALARDISAAIVAMQFQDRVSQRIGHVVDALTSMCESLSTALPHVDDTAVSARRDEVEARLTGSYTMWEERNDLTHAGDGDVELF